MAASARPGIPSFKDWEHAIEAANAAFEQNEESSLSRYEAAIAIASALLDSEPWNMSAEPDSQAECLDSAIAALVISHHNAANACRDVARYAQAIDHYRAAHIAVSALCASVRLSPALHAMASRHLTRTLGELIHFKHRCGNLPTNQHDDALTDRISVH